MGNTKYAIQNVVVTGKLADNLNLLAINDVIPGSVYEPGKFPALRIKIFDVGFLLYTSGRFVCSGAKSVEEAKEKVKKFVNFLIEKGIQVDENPKINVRNIVISVDLNKKLRLHELAYVIPDSEYDPEAFPGMKIKKGNTRILIFRTGKAIIPGLKDHEEIENTIDWLENTIEAAEEEAASFRNY